ncbi:MAG: TetR family transcriptional regulator [Proteobacteria bacterium]|nr:TetR family transcriptional regulator [Pseudomonadota bacterium]HQR04415.1 TetR/AcrR family transcriptional regulator [Rhodocyclaceae bacterium]
MGQPLSSSGNDGPDIRILDAAERLFMEHGYEATSTRMVTRDAAVNLAAVNYYFGSKEGLMQAVLRRRLDWLNRERLHLLDAAETEARGAPLKPSLIVDYFFGTLLRMGARPETGGQTFQRLLGRTHTEPAAFISTFLASEYADVVNRYKSALCRALPDVPREEIVWRFHFMLGATAYAITGTDSLQLITDWKMEEDVQVQAQKLLARLMSFLLGGLRAPLPQSRSA